MEMTLTSGPGYGYFPKAEYGKVWNRTGTTVALCEVVMCDMTDSDADNATFSYTLGNSGTNTSNVMVPNTDGIGGLSGATIKAGFIFGVVTDLLTGAGADNTEIIVQWKGYAKVAMVATAITTGVALCAANNVKTLTPTFAAGNKCLALASQPNGSAAGNYWCWFDGVNGFGCPAAS